MSDFELEQGKSQKALDSANNESTAEVSSQSSIQTVDVPAVAYSKDGFKAALEANNTDQISGMLNGLTAENAKEIAADAGIMGLIEGLELGIRNSAYDKIYAGIENIDALCKIFLNRFNVALGSKYSSDSDAIATARKLLAEDKEQEWTLNGARRVYALFMKLPASHLKNLKIVMTSNTVNGGYGGAALSASGVYYFNYADGDCNTYIDHSSMYHGDINEDGETVVNENDANYGLNYFDSTAAHELGHVVDYTQSTRFSDRDDFLKITGWKKYETFSDDNAVKEVIKDTRTYMDHADPEGLEGDTAAAAIIDSVGEHMIKERINEEAGISAVVEEAIFSDENVIEEKTEGTLFLDAAKARMEEINEAWRQNNYAFRSDEERDEYYALYDKCKIKERLNAIGKSANDYADSNGKNIEKFADTLKTAPILKHIARANKGNDPWFHGEPFNNLHGRQIHSDYHGLDWFSYDVSARANKISNYQFSTPAEEFAELYASYMAADDKTRKTPEPPKSWFEENVLPLKPPQPVLDAAAQGTTPTTAGGSPSTAGTSGTVAGDSQSSSQESEGSKDKGKDKKKKKWWQFWK